MAAAPAMRIRRFGPRGAGAAGSRPALGVSLATLKYWLKGYRLRNGVVDAQEEKDLRKRVVELEMENARLRIERDILKKAAAWFAKEQL